MVSEQPANLENWRLTMGLIAWIICEQNEEIKDILAHFQEHYFNVEPPASLFRPSLPDINYIILNMFVNPLDFEKANTYAMSSYQLNLNSIREALNPLSHFNRTSHLHSWLFYESLRVIYGNTMF